MKRYIRSDSGYPYPYKQSPEYKRLMELGYTLDVNDASSNNSIRDRKYGDMSVREYPDACIIYFPDGEPYATFDFVEPTDPEWLDDFAVAHGLDGWDVYADDYRINERIDYEPHTFDQCVTCAIRYFLSYY